MNSIRILFLIKEKKNTKNQREQKGQHSRGGGRGQWNRGRVQQDSIEEDRFHTFLFRLNISINIDCINIQFSYRLIVDNKSNCVYSALVVGIRSSELVVNNFDATFNVPPVSFACFAVCKSVVVECCCC